MKYLVLLIDGMADMPISQLNGKTPLEVAHKPCMDMLAKKSELGILHVTPDGCKGGSEIGNMCIMGYDPRTYLTGRSPLEAASIGIEMADDDLALRCNLVSLSDTEPYERKMMLDYSAGEISTAEADILIKAINTEFKNDFCEFYTGISYRHCLILHHAKDKMTLTPPHNITGKEVTEYLPKGDYATIFLQMMERSNIFLKKHPINLARLDKGLNPANSIWLWGQGRRMSLPSFMQRHGIKGAVVTAVDLIKGIAVCADMKTYEVQGATGTLHTNFTGKAQAGIQAFKDGYDLLYMHLEAPDECGHQGDVSGKVKAGELIDEKVLTPIYQYLKNCGEDFAILITPDHPTPLSTRGHSSDDVPYMIYRSTDEQAGHGCYCEKTCKETGNYIKDGFKIIDSLLQNEETP